jgi:8-oxo-dGTP pyrophosphatase MutT (NUDIX family)
VGADLPRHTRYQGAIVRGHEILLITHRRHATGRTRWVFPGGGIEATETEAECVIREMREETHLVVAVERLLLDEPGHPDGVYKRRKTYLCRPLSGEAAPGVEPEEEAAAEYAIGEVRWFDLRRHEAWDRDLRADPITFPQLMRIRDALGYES